MSLRHPVAIYIIPQTVSLMLRENFLTTSSSAPGCASLPQDRSQEGSLCSVSRALTGPQGPCHLRPSHDSRPSHDLSPGGAGLVVRVGQGLMPIDSELRGAVVCEAE